MLHGEADLLGFKVDAGVSSCTNVSEPISPVPHVIYGVICMYQVVEEASPFSA